jgi:DNA-binding MurR/RpiR family transcriptional regulator
VLQDTGDGVAAGFAELRGRIVARYPSLSPQQRSIAEFAMANPDTMAVDTAQRLAERMSVPPSSIVRFAQSLGYSGFNELRLALRQHLVYQLGEARERAAIRAQPPTGAVAVLDAVLSEAARDVERLTRQLDRTQFDRAALELARAEGLAIAAQGACFALGAAFHWTALSLGRPCRMLSAAGGYAEREADLLSRDEAMLAISFPPYQAAVVGMARAHADRGGPVVVITDSMLSPLAAADAGDGASAGQRAPRHAGARHRGWGDLADFARDVNRRSPGHKLGSHDQGNDLRARALVLAPDRRDGPAMLRRLELLRQRHRHRQFDHPQRILHNGQKLRPLV